MLVKIVGKYSEVTSFRNLKYWYIGLKNGMRAVGNSSKMKAENKKEVVQEYLNKAQLFSQKIKKEKLILPLQDEKDLKNILSLEHYLELLDKHIALLERREIKGETIPHAEKLFSIFEPETEWISKGKQHPSVELGKNVQVTTNQYHLIIDHKVMEHEVDKSCVISLAYRILSKYKVSSWSFDKGFYSKDNKALLQLVISDLIMPKKGKLNKTEYAEEHTPKFKKLPHKHSAVESNINELECKGLDRCPDKGFAHFKRYVAAVVCAYNLTRIGAELRRQEKMKMLLKKAA